MLVTSEEVERLIVETHSTVAMLVERSTGIEDKLLGVQRRIDKINGSVADIQGEQSEQKGAVGALKWLLAVLISVTSAGAAIAGIVLAIVAR